MAITLGGNSSAAWSETFSYSCLTGNTSTGGMSTGILMYIGSMTETYQYEVDSVEIILNSSSASVSRISGKTVSYRVTSGMSNAKVMFTAKVTFKAISPTSAITNVIRKNPNTGETSSINYIKRKSTGTYFWTRPTTIALQLPWNYFKSWELKRTDGLNPSSSADVIANNTTLATSGTGTYDISGIYYGDRLEFTYTLKPGGSVDVYNGERLTVDPDFSIKNTTASTGALPSPAAELNSQWNFEKKDKDTVKNASNAEALTITVTKPTELSGIGVNISICKTAAESYYMNKTLGFWGGINTDTSCNLSIQDGATLTSSYTSLGSISASETSKTWTLCVDGGDKSWPKYVKVGIQMKIQDSYASAHKFSNSSGTLNAYKGTKTVASGGGGGGDTGSWGGGYGGWMPS